jgi:hypothetical protein
MPVFRSIHPLQHSEKNFNSIHPNECTTQHLLFELSSTTTVHGLFTPTKIRPNGQELQLGPWMSQISNSSCCHSTRRFWGAGHLPHTQYHVSHFRPWSSIEIIWPCVRALVPRPAPHTALKAQFLVPRPLDDYRSFNRELNSALDVQSSQIQSLTQGPKTIALRRSTRLDTPAARSEAG